MYSGIGESWLECDDCGDTVKRLSPEEVDKVARNPYNYIVYCRECIKDRRREFHLEA